MKKFIGVIGFLLIAAQCQSVFADEVPNPMGQWVSVIKNADNTVYQLNNGIYKQGQTTAFWMQSYSPNGQRVAAYIGANCTSGAYQSFAEYRLDSNGNVIAKNNTHSPILYAQNGTVAAILIETACGNTNNAQADIVKAQLEALTRNSQTSAELINNVMRNTASLYK